MMTDITVLLNNLGYDLDERGTTLRLQYFKNRDGSIRWLWPASLNKPLFLQLYNGHGVLSRLFVIAIQCIYAMGIQNFIFDSVKCAISTPQLAANPNILQSQWALFTGTKGPNQKYILYSIDDNNIENYTKIGINPKGISLINHEYKTLKWLGKLSDKTFSTPSISQITTNSVALKKPNEKLYPSTQLSDQHFDIFMYFDTITGQRITSNEYFLRHKIKARIDRLASSKQKMGYGIIKKLELLYKNLQHQSIDTHFAHGDFTPWNMYSIPHKNLYVYDWELGHAAYVKGFDFFHYIIQNGILVDRKNWNDIKKDLHKYTPHAYFADYDFNSLLGHYLLVNILYYAELYDIQEDWHVQIQWLLDTWNEALSDILGTYCEHRMLVCLDIFDYLHYKPYAALKMERVAPDEISLFSDIDIVMSKSLSKLLYQYLYHHPLVQNINCTGVFTLTNLEIRTHNDTILSLDCIHEIKRKHLVFLSASETILRSITNSHGIKCVNENDTALYIGLFYALNHAKVPQKYMHYSDALSTHDPLSTSLKKYYLSEDIQYTFIQNTVKKMSINTGLHYINNMIKYALDVICTLKLYRGAVITFSGVDGAGKSTIIEKTKYHIEKKLRRRVVVLRHRPSLLPILSAWTKGKIEAEKLAAKTLPRQGKNNNLLSSLLRFGYYYIDYLIGQFYVYLKYVWRGDIVLYDRYYFDFINDSIRSNIRLPKWIVKSAYFFLITPSLNVFLYAQPDIIIQRKQELSASTIQHLTSQYLQLFKELSLHQQDRYISIENLDLDHTLSLVSRAIHHTINI